jgi:hypothetical protein
MFIVHLTVIALATAVSATSVQLDTIVTCDQKLNDKASRQCHALARGLSQKSSWEAIATFDAEFNLKQARIEYGLPEDSDWEDVEQYLEEKEAHDSTQVAAAEQAAEITRMADESHRARARELGLPESSDSKTIERHSSELDREQYALDHGLPRDSSFEVINAKVWLETIAFYRAKGIDIIPRQKVNVSKKEPTNSKVVKSQKKKRR